MGPSLLITFDDTEELERELDNRMSGGRVRAQGEYELNPGEACEVVLVHPESGEALEIAGEVESVDEDGVNVKFAATPLVVNRLKKLAGLGGRESLQRRIRALKGNQRRRLALTGDLTERTALERAYGKDVWDALLDNPRLTVGEVVRLARNNSMPQPLVEKIMINNAWLKVPQIRRALLANRRCDGKMIQKLFRFTPASEMRMMPDNSAYPMAVRQAARRVVGKK